MPITQAVNGGGTSPTLTRRVYYLGTDELKEGYALCYNFDALDVSPENLPLATGAAGADDECPARHIQVEKPSPYNQMWFAGTVSNKSAGVVGPGFVEINMPSSICNIWCEANVDHSKQTTALSAAGTGSNTGQMLTFSMNSYGFKYAGLPGEGSAIILQDVDRSTTAGLVMAKLCVGTPSGGVLSAYSLNSSNLTISTLNNSIASSLMGAVSIIQPVHGVMRFDYSFPAATFSMSVLAADAEFIGQTKIFKLASTIAGGVKITFNPYHIYSVVTGSTIQGNIVGTLATLSQEIQARWTGDAWELQTPADAWTDIF